jgi:RimJ/RimL family protein N-acetyltransferase
VSVEVALRPTRPDDLDVMFDHQADPEAAEMAAFPSRERDAFMAHWARIMADDTVVSRTIDVDGAVAGNIVSWIQDDARMVGYWIGRDYWGRGVASAALALFLEQVATRPLWAHVARHNVGSRRVLEKSGFQPYSQDADEYVLLLA